MNDGFDRVAEALVQRKRTLLDAVRQISEERGALAEPLQSMPLSQSLVSWHTAAVQSR